MGIPSYYKWLLTRFRSFQAGTPRSNGIPVEHIYVDLNCFFHNAARRAGRASGNKGSGNKGKGKKGGSHDGSERERQIVQFLGLVQREIDGLVAGFDPAHLKSVYLAVDGPASRAKVLLQRKRRRGKEGSYLSLGLSPGTQLMDRITRSLREYCGGLAKRKGVDVVFDGGGNPGEGEHKMLDGMKRNLISRGNENFNAGVGGENLEASGKLFLN